jgi:hypothetical protein
MRGTVMRISGLLVALLSVVIIASIEPAWAQAPATIRQIADLSNLEKPKQIKEATDKVRVKRQTGGGWSFGGPDTSLYRNDQMLVQADTRVQLQIRLASQRGDLTVSPDSLEKGLGDGLYEVRQDIERKSDLSFHILRGTLWVDWALGKLTVIAGGTRNVWSGTKGDVIVGHNSEEAILFLDRGTVEFPDYPSFRLRTLEAALLRAGQRPVRLTLPPLNIIKIHDLIEYNTETLWSQFRPWWQHWYVIAPAAVVTGIGVYELLKPRTEKVEGSVTVEIPR